MGKVEQTLYTPPPDRKGSSTPVKKDDEASALRRYFNRIDQFPLLTPEEKIIHTKTFSTIELATYLLEDITTGIREEKRKLTLPTARGDNQKAPILSKEVAETLLEDLTLKGKINLICDDEEIQGLETNRKLTDHEKEQRKAVIGYRWEKDIQPSEAETLSKQLERQITNAKNAKQTMINHNLRLVVSTAREYKKPIPFEDRVQSGFFGLVRAVEKFDYRKGFEFSTYASDWIKQSIQRASYEANALHIPRTVLESIDVATRLAHKYEETHAEFPKQRELIELMKENGVTREADRKDAATIYLYSQSYVLSLENTILGDPNMPLKTALPDKSVDVEASVLERETVRAALTDLSDSERKVLELSFWSDLTVKEIAEIMKMPAQSVSRIKNRAIKKLKDNHQISQIYKSNQKEKQR